MQARTSGATAVPWAQCNAEQCHAADQASQTSATAESGPFGWPASALRTDQRALTCHQTRVQQEVLVPAAGIRNTCMQEGPSRKRGLEARRDWPSRRRVHAPSWFQTYCMWVHAHSFLALGPRIRAGQQSSGAGHAPMCAVVSHFTSMPLRRACLALGPRLRWAAGLTTPTRTWKCRSHPATASAA